MADESARIDKWLWHARMVKTRSLAQKLVANGRVRINRIRTSSPSRTVRIGDVLTITLPARVRVLRVIGIAQRRGPFAEAQALYEDLSPPATLAPEAPAIAPQPKTPRPDRRQRREAAALRGKIV